MRPLQDQRDKKRNCRHRRGNVSHGESATPGEVYDRRCALDRLEVLEQSGRAVPILGQVVAAPGVAAQVPWS